MNHYRNCLLQKIETTIVANGNLVNILSSLEYSSFIGGNQILEFESILIITQYPTTKSSFIESVTATYTFHPNPHILPYPQLTLSFPSCLNYNMRVTTNIKRKKNNAARKPTTLVSTLFSSATTTQRKAYVSEISVLLFT